MFSDTEPWKKGNEEISPVVLQAKQIVDAVEAEFEHRVVQDAALVSDAMPKEVEVARLEAEHLKDTGLAKAGQLKVRAMALVREPQFQTCTVVTSLGAVTFGAVGGAFGMATGLVVGAAAGVAPALLTFGFSLPAGATLGAGAGLCTGTLLGATSGGLAGCAAFKYRLEIKDGILHLKVQSLEASEVARVKFDMIVTTGKANAYSVINSAKSKSLAAARAAKCKAEATVRATKARISEVVEAVTEKTNQVATLATSTRVTATSTAAAAGGILGGTAGGVAGTVAGAAVGVIPAVFTLGMSIPVCAALGMCAGTAVGGVTGSVGGGVVGYGGFTHRE